jgi:shikimate dehydrogenase
MTDKYCVIGNPIAHSRSPEIHAVFAAQAGQDISYERCLAPVDGFADTVQRLIADGYKGANVTVPFKLDAARPARSTPWPSAMAKSAATTPTGQGWWPTSSAMPACRWPESGC